MIHIVICDDDINHLKNTFEFVENHLKFSPYADLEFRVEITTNPAEIETLSELAPPDILILDIHMPNIDGFEIAETFNLCKAKTKIIFLSNYEELVFYSLRFSPFRFVRKNAMSAELPEAINSALKLIQNDNTNLLVRHYNDIRYVPLNNIKYIEKIKNRNAVNIVCRNETVQYRETIQVLENTLSQQGFVRINSGTLVNLKYIKRICGCELLIDDTYLKISSSQIDKVKKSLTKYMRDYGTY